MKYDLGRDMQAYLDKMDNEMARLNVSDTDCMAFLLQVLPEHF